MAWIFHVVAFFLRDVA